MSSHKGKKVVIQAPQSTAVGSEVFEETWKVLFNAIKEIFNQNASVLSYEELYRSAYNLVLQRYGEALYNSVEQCMKDRIEILARNANDFLDETFLRDIVETWEEFKSAITMIRDILMYMDRNYVVQTDKKPYYDNTVLQFKELVLQQTKSGVRITEQMIDRIQKERRGSAIDRQLMKQATLMLTDLLSYEQVLESKLLEVTRAHYQKLADELIRKETVPEYLLRVENFLKEEVERVQAYLNESTKYKIESIIREEMITKYMQTVLENEATGFISLIRDDRIIDLNRMYKLFSFDSEHLQKLIERFRTYISEYGKKYVQSEEHLKDPITFVQGLIEQKKKYDKIAAQSFLNHSSFTEALTAGFGEFANGSVQQRESEFLSLYVDDTIYKYNSKQIADVDSIFEDVMGIFKFLLEKDIFENYFKIHLSKRLLMARHHAAQQEEVEKQFIQKLKSACGHHFTSRIEGMFNDMRLSRESLELYHQHKAYYIKDPQIDLNINILTASFWPSYSISKAALPVEMESCLASFNSYYNEVHSGRKITWQQSLGDGIMIARFPGSKHEILVSTYQMVILLLFNTKNELSFKEIKEQTQIPEKDLKRSLLTLCFGKNKILLKADKLKDFNDEHKLAWNSRFTSANVRIKVGMVFAQETPFEPHEGGKIDAEKIPEIEANLVRIIKGKKSMHHEELVEELTSSLSSKFTLNPREIKRRIESLIDRDFIARDETNPTMYNYTA